MNAGALLLVGLALALPAEAPSAPDEAAPIPDKSATQVANGGSTRSAVDATQVAKDGASALARATEALLLDRHEDAANEAFRALTKIKPSEDKYESAEFILAEALSALGLTQASAEYYFSVASRRQNVALLPRALEGLQRLVRRQAIDEDRLFSGVLIDADVAILNPEMASFMAYHRGLSNLRLGYRRWAISDFSTLDKASFYGRLAQLVRAATYVKDGKAERAAEVAEELLADDGSPPEILRRARVMKARLQYGRGEYREAIETYRSVRETEQTPAGKLLMERAWAHYQAGEHHDAMGLLFALGAPSSRELFLPEQYILRGLIYQNFCHFRAAKGAVRDFRARYGEALKALEAGTAPEVIPLVVAAAERLPEATNIVNVKRGLVQETARLSALQSTLLQSGLHKQLSAMYTMIDRRVEREYRRVMGLAARWTAEDLLVAREQANLLAYELGVSIFKSIDPASGEVKLRPPAEVIPLGGGKTYFQFDGEFWSDELEDMRFLIQDRCVK